MSQGSIRLGFTVRGCFDYDNVTIDGVGYTVHSSKWQRRDDENSPWTDIPDTDYEGGVCSYSPTEPGQYRGVAEISIGGERGNTPPTTS